MAYVVIEHFCDMQDGGRSYEVGDKFPRAGYNASQARLDTLATNRNALGRPLIKAVEEKKMVKAVVSTETTADTTPTPKAPKKSGTRKKNN